MSDWRPNIPGVGAFTSDPQTEASPAPLDRAKCYTITKAVFAAKTPLRGSAVASPPRPRRSSGHHTAVAAAAVGLGAARLRGRDRRLPVGGRVLGHGMTDATLRFQDVTLGYARHPAVHHLDGAVTRGALVAVCGPNGGGKSTLFKGIVGLLTPLAGTIAVNGCAVRDIAYLPQIADIDRSFPINVYD